jgi:hypothetical protein
LLSGLRSLAAVAALLILLSVVAVSILVARIATRAFMLTGLSKETARFQARSIITGTGFTTDEAEHIVNHPVRRRISLTLMLIGTAAEALRRGLFLAAGLGALAYLALSDRVDRYLSRLIEWMLDRVVGVQVRDMHTILNLGGGHMVTRMEVDPESWLAGETLRTVNLPAQGLIVLAIERPDETVDYAPGADGCVPPGGSIIAYGPEERIAHLCDQLQCEFDPTEAADSA